MSIQSAQLVSCDRDGCYGSLVYLGGPMTPREVAKGSGWQVSLPGRFPWDSQPDVCPACLAGTGPITKTACPSCGGFGGNLICVYCRAEQPRDVEG